MATDPAPTVPAANRGQLTGASGGRDWAEGTGSVTDRIVHPSLVLSVAVPLKTASRSRIPCNPRPSDGSSADASGLAAFWLSPSVRVVVTGSETGSVC